MLKCAKCEKEFASPNALRMHDMRTHLGIIKVPNEGGPKLGRPQLGRPPGRPKKKRGNFNPENRWTQDQMDLLRVIEDKYRVGNSIRWEAAFSEHPEWRADLGNRGNLALSAKLNYMRATAPQRAKREAEKAVRNGVDVQVIETRPRQVVQAAPAAPLQVQSNGVAFCPECGAHIKIWNHVAGIVHGLSKQKQNQ